MRISRPRAVLIALSTLSVTKGFSPTWNTPCTSSFSSRSALTTTLRIATDTSDLTKANDFGSAMPVEVDPHDIIGVKPEELALGINADDFLEWVGTKTELMAKVQSDNPSWSEERAEEEVSRFMMDQEGANMYIKYMKDKKMNPRDYAAEAEAELSLSNPRTIATYAAWLIGGLSFGWVRTNIIEPKFSSGEWSDIHINLPFLSKPDAAAEAVSSVSKASGAILEHVIDPVVQNSANLVS